MPSTFVCKANGDLVACKLTFKRTTERNGVKHMTVASR